MWHLLNSAKKIIDADVASSRTTVKERTSGWFAITAALCFLVRLTLEPVADPVTAATGIICCLMFGNYLLAKTSTLSNYSALLLMITTAASLIYISYISGGATSAVIVLLPMVPMMTALLIGRTEAWYLAGALAVSLVLVDIFQSDALSFAHGRDVDEALTVFWVVLAILVGSLIGHQFAAANEALAETLRDRAHFDFLTNVPNRRGIDERLQEFIKNSGRKNEWLCVMMLDIDHFKRYNDINGHAEGDECLKRVASALNRALNRPLDFVGRYGGEEFTVVLPATDLDGAKIVAETLRSAVQILGIPYQLGEPELVTATIGGVCVRGGQYTPNQLLAEADTMLYKGKKLGRNCTHCKLLVHEDQQQDETMAG